MQKEWKILIGLVILIGLFIILSPKPHPKLNEMSVKQIILDDLHTKYPNANVSILRITEKKNTQNQTYYNVKTKVVLNPGTPCPERMHIYYNYPEQKFVPQPPEYITKGCQVCVNEICTLMYPEEAAIASHTFKGTDAVSDFLKSHNDAHYVVTKGHINIQNQAENKTAIMWNVDWISGNETMNIKILDNGTILSIDEK